jgi:hypothetical protein
MFMLILEMGSVIPRKKVFIPRHSEVYGRVNSEARNGRKWHEKISFFKISCSSKQNSQHVFVRDKLRNRILRVFFYFWSTARNSELFSLPRNGSEQNSKCLLLFLFHRNRIPSFSLLRNSSEQNSEHFSPLWNGSERNSESFLFCGTARICWNQPFVPSIPSSAE